jgi:hypothetical protein
MCVVKTPKVQATDAQAKTPEPTIIRNPYLDGVDPASRSLRMGSSSLRIERGGGGVRPPSPGAITRPPVATPTPAPAAPSRPPGLAGAIMGNRAKARPKIASLGVAAILRSAGFA